MGFIEHNPLLPVSSRVAATSRWRRLPLRSSVLLVLLTCAYLVVDLLNESPSKFRNPAYLIHAENGAVASENERCSNIGVRALQDGGNAVDAAIAVTFCLGVVNMFSYVSHCRLCVLLHRYPGRASVVADL